MGYDGSVNIDTKIDTKGFNKGTRSIRASLSGVMKSIMAVGKVMAAAFIGGSIIAGIRSVIGSFDLMNSSIGKSLKTLSTSFASLKSSFASLILTAFAPMIPYVIAAVNWLTKLFTTLAQVTAALFGTSVAMAKVKDETTSTAKEAKKATGALAGFDQINVLSQPEAAAGAGVGDVIPPDAVPTGLLDKVQEWKDKMITFLQPVIDALGRLYEALKPLGETIWAGLKWAWDNILVPLGAWVISEALPAFLDLLSKGAGVLNEVLLALQPVWQEFYDGFLQPLAEWAGGKIIEFLDWLTLKLGELAVWIRENPEKFQNFVKIIAGIMLAFYLLAGAVWLVNAAVGVWTTVSALATGATALFSAAMAVLASPIALIILLIIGIIAVVYLLIANWETLKTTVYQIFWLIGYWVATMVMIPIIKGFGTALDWVKEKFTTIFTGIKDFVKGIINNIIDMINGMVGSVVGGINGIVDAFNSVGNIMPGFSPLSPVSAPQIPRLATGAVIPPNSQFAAILGDQKSGMNLEGPESMFRRIVREESGNGAGQEVTVNIPVYLDSEKIYDGQKKVQTRRGSSLITSGATS